MTRSAAERRKRSKWRTGVWIVLLGCVALLAGLLVQGFFSSAGLVLKLEAFVGFFVIGCILLLVSRYSGGKKKQNADS